MWANSLTKMTSAFSSNDTDCLNRVTEHEIDVENIDEIWDERRLDECVKWINSHQYDKVSVVTGIGNSLKNKQN